MTVTYVKNHLKKIRKSRSFDIQKLMLQEIMMVNDIAKDVLNV